MKNIGYALIFVSLSAMCFVLVGLLATDFARHVAAARADGGGL